MEIRAVRKKNPKLLEEEEGYLSDRLTDQLLKYDSSLQSADEYKAFKKVLKTTYDSYSVVVVDLVHYHK